MKVRTSHTTETTIEYDDKLNIFIISILLLSCFASAPLYLLASGGFQLTDVAIILLSVAIFKDLRKNEIRIGIHLVGPFIPFVVWSVIVNSYYAMVAVDLSSKDLLTSLQVLYVFFVFFIFCITFSKAFSFVGVRKLLYFCLLLSCATPWIFHKELQLARISLSFNNPNQLAFFSLLFFFMLLSIDLINFNEKNRKQRIVFNIINLLILVVANIYSYLSGSRSVIAGIILYNLYFFLFSLKKDKFLLIIILTLSLAISVNFLFIHNGSIYFNSIGVEEINKTMNKRFSKNISADFKQRVFDQIQFDNDIQVIIGEGGLKNEEKTVENLFQKETHNTLGQVFREYGVVGFSFFVGGLLLLFSRLGLYPLKKWFLLLPILIYHMTHNGMRFRFWWIALALFSVISLIINRRRNYQEANLTSLRES